MGIFKAHPPESSQQAVCSRIHLGVLCSLAFGMALLAAPVVARESIACDSEVTVKRGDTLSLIARRCGMSLQALLAANPQIRDPNIVSLGSVLTTSKNAEAEEAEKGNVETTGSIVIEPSEAGSGERITLTASGLPPRVRVWIKGGGPSPKHHLVLRGARTNAQGQLRTMLRLPRLSPSALRDYRLSVEVPGTGTTLLSSPLEVPAKRSADKSR